ncbi:MAG: GAF domain-containing protein [Proteobacteria bacterium]|nr:GAF domain-containing protein [Desulfobacula sp.]MBU3953985.1 GAF domain-containing protein [Pseudomonadota bacterium]
MKNTAPTHSIKSAVSLDPLLAFWEKNLVPHCSHMRSMFRELTEKISQIPQIQGAIKDVGILSQYHDIIRPLMSPVFPAASFNKEIMGALTPCTFEPFFVTPEFQRLFLDRDNFFKAPLRKDLETETSKKLLRIYFLILERIYGFNCRQPESVDIKIVADEKTGLARYFGVTADFQFVRITPLGSPKNLSEQDREQITNNLTDMNILAGYIDLNQFEFTGFTIVRALDITQSEVISALERDLIDQHAIFSAEGIKHLESRLQVLFQRPEIAVGLGALQGDQVMIIKNDCNSTINCLFSNSHHLHLDALKGSVWMEAAKNSTVFRVPDLSQKKDLVPVEQQAVSAGIRSMLLSPLSYQGKVIGILEVFTTTPNELGPIDAMLLEQVTPIFSVALKRGLDEMNKHVQSIIKEKCTAVHPSVEWRFEQAAISHMERLRQGTTTSGMEPIIFKDVVPFFGQSDIRGSSLARNQGIQQDLTDQLRLALGIMETGSKLRSWPILQEYTFRIRTKIQEIASGVNSSDENSVFSLLNKDVFSTFEDLAGLGPDIARQIDHYNTALDPVAGMIYNKRKDYEESVSRLNHALSSFLEQEDALIQKDFPHYFEKRQTDGVDYMMYIGASMVERQRLANFHVQDMTLWQLMLACGLAWQTKKIQPGLKVPLDTCHLILVNHTPLSIRFRFDEKRFDVDGAYDVRQEIIKSRLDKALIKGTGERLTQPGRIAVVYSNPSEGKEIKQHIDFLMGAGKLDNDLEMLELDDLPDVRGLKALRVGVNLKAMAANNIIEMKTG